jgi:hypothetical protein
MSRITMISKPLLATAVIAFAFAVAAPVGFNPLQGGFSAKQASAKHGADDPAGHDAGDDKGGAKGNGGKGRGGKDDGPNHR